MIAKVTEDVRAVMSDTRATLDPIALEAAAGRISEARRVVLYGVGASGIVARDLHLKLERIGIASSIADDPHNALTLASVLGPKDVLVITSHSGTTVEALEVAPRPRCTRPPSSRSRPRHLAADPPRDHVCSASPGPRATCAPPRWAAG